MCTRYEIFQCVCKNALFVISREDLVLVTSNNSQKKLKGHNRHFYIFFQMLYFFLSVEIIKSVLKEQPDWI